jgi:ankyrin repeat protein
MEKQMKVNQQLQRAVSDGNLKLVKSLINKGCILNAKDNYGRTLIYDAIVKGYKDIVKEFCIANADINNQDINGKTPLHFSCIYGNLEITKLLIGYGANVNIRDKNGNIPIFDAIFNSNGETEIISMLIDCKSDYKTPNIHGVSPKELAESIANFDVSYLFLE